MGCLKIDPIFFYLNAHHQANHECSTKENDEVRNELEGLDVGCWGLAHILVLGMSYLNTDFESINCIDFSIIEKF